MPGGHLPRRAMKGGADMIDLAGARTEATPHPNGLAQAMAIAGMDTPTLARQAGVKPGDIQAWIGGQRHLRPAMATRLSVPLHTTAADLLIGLGCGEPLYPVSGEGIDGRTSLPLPRQAAGPGALAEAVLVLTAAILMGIVGCLAVWS